MKSGRSLGRRIAKAWWILGVVPVLAATLARCQIYQPSLLVPAEAGPERGGGLGWWSGPGMGGCYSARQPTPEQRPLVQSAPSLPPIYMAIRSMRLGGFDLEGMPSKSAWQDIGFDLDDTCTLSQTCPSDPNMPAVACKPTGTSVAFDGNYCRDNTFGRLEILASTIPEVGGKYGLNDDAFNCALCVGAYNFMLKFSDYNGTPNDDQIRIDMYPSPGLEKILPWNCATGDWKNHPCFTADQPLTIQDTGVAEARGGPDLPAALLFDDKAYVRDGYIVMHLPTNAIFSFPGKKALATAFPVSFKQGVVSGHIGRGRDGTWGIDDGVIAGRTSEADTVRSFRQIGFCPSDPNYRLMTEFLHNNLDILSSGDTNPAVTCDAISLGIGFAASQATAGKLVHVDPLVDCPVVDGGVIVDAGDGGG